MSQRSVTDNNRKKSARGPVLFAVFFGVIAGLLAGSVVMSVAWQHNPQGEIHIDGDVHWGHWVLIGVSWAIPAALIVGPLMFVFWRAVYRVGERPSDRKAI